MYLKLREIPTSLMSTSVDQYQYRILKLSLNDGYLIQSTIIMFMFQFFLN
uniref:Uncharacterized protein n=1 Tax=Amphimedon queenslandica TaxID=400682 RepID=A0A1X7SGI9_AMPQE